MASLPWPSKSSCPTPHSDTLILCVTLCYNNHPFLFSNGRRLSLSFWPGRFLLTSHRSAHTHHPFQFPLSLTSLCRVLYCFWFCPCCMYAHPFSSPHGYLPSPPLPYTGRFRSHALRLVAIAYASSYILSAYLGSRIQPLHGSPRASRSHGYGWFSFLYY